MNEESENKNDHKKKLFILAIGVVLLGAGMYFVVDHSNQRAEQAEADLASLEKQTPKQAPAQPMASANTNPATTPAPTATATTTGTAPATAGTATTPAPAAVANAPGQTAPPATTTPAAPPSAASTGPVAATPPPAAAPPAETAKTPDKQLIASAPTAPAVPVPPVAATPPTTPTPPPVAEEPPNPNAIGVERLKKRFPSVKKEEVVAEARQAAGRSDPMMPFLGGHQFPHYSKGLPVEEEPDKTKTAEAVKVPPPPPIAEAPKVKSTVPTGLVPPPPPTDPSLAGVGGDLPLNQLPEAPDKPSVADKLRLTSVIGNKVILQVPFIVRQQNKWPATISLAPGEQFESLSVVSVDGDSVTLDEDGERRVLTLATIK